jgi:glycosyltransferase involved in cell wall biosynthesis
MTPCISILVVTGIFPPDIGGPASYVPAISTALVKHGHKVTVVTLSDSIEHDDHPYSFHVRRILRNAFKPWRFVLAVSAILRKGRQAQVLYVNGLQLEAVIANFFLRKPLVQKIVGDWAWERSTNKGWIEDNFEEFQERRYCLKIELLKILRRFCAGRADAVIAPSQYLARVVAGWGVAEAKIIVVYNAVEVPAFIPTSVPLSAQLKVVTVGRLVPWKQVDHLIELLVDCDETGLVIVGDGPERDRLEELVRSHHLVDRVYFAGQRSKEDTFALMAACDLFVLNSTYEGFPHVVLEAMAAGLPVVATAVGGTPELVRSGENGLLVEPGAKANLLATLMSLGASSKVRQRLAEGGRQTIQRFRREAMIERTEAILKFHAD